MIMNVPCETKPKIAKENIRDSKFPFIGKFSRFTENKIQKLTKRLFKEGTSIKIIFSTFKLAYPFLTKVKAQYGLKFCVICIFLCSSCNASHIGKTYRHISTRIYEH